MTRAGALGFALREPMQRIYPTASSPEQYIATEAHRQVIAEIVCPRCGKGRLHRANGDLLGYKFGAWEGGHRVPFIARWPGTIPAGSKSDQLICSVDLLATFAAITRQPLERKRQAPRTKREI